MLNGNVKESNLTYNLMSQGFVKLKELSPHSRNICLFEVDKFWLDVYQVRMIEIKEADVQREELSRTLA